MTKYPKGNEPDYNELPLLTKESRTGRFVHNATPYKEPKVMMIAHVPMSNKALALSHMVNADFSEIERRVLGHMQVKKDPSWLRIVEVLELSMVQAMGRWMARMWAYGNIEAVQERIDEEGCGAVICAARLIEND